MYATADLFEVTAAAADVAARRLTTATYVAARMSAETPPTPAALEALIDDASDAFARYCRLARQGATPSANNTFAAGDVLKLTVAGGGSGGSPKGHVALDFQRA